MQTWDLAVRFVYIFRRRWFFVLLAGFLSGVSAIYVMQGQPSIYVARTSLMVGNNLRNPNPGENATGVGMTLAAFYAEMAHRTPITGQVVKDLQLPFGPEVLNEDIVSARVVPQAQLVEISVLDTNPERSARIANAIAHELTKFSPTSPEKVAEQRQFTQSQINDLQDKIKRTDQSIQELNIALQSMTSAGEIAEAQQRLREPETIKSTDQDTYNGLVATLGDSSLNMLTVFEAAAVPSTPLPRRTFPAIVLAALLGLVVGMGTAWVIEQLDDYWRPGRSTEMVVQVPNLGIVPVRPRPLGTSTLLNVPQAKDFLALRSEILLHLAPTARYALMITSARASLERSRVSSYLADIFARSGQNVLLVDANLGENFIADIFNVEGDAVQKLLRDPSYPLENLAQPTKLPNLMLLPGNTGAQSAHLVPTLHWPQAVQTIEQSAEIAIFDGPPVLESADATLLAPHMGGVVLVIDPGTEYCSDTRRALARLRELDAPLLGVVLLAYQRKPFWQMFRRAAAPQPIA